MSVVTEANETNFDSEVLKASGPVLVDFSATWCGPCKKLEPIVHEVASDYEGRLKVVKVDVDKAPRLAARFRVQGIPLLMFFRDGQSVHSQAGAPPKPALEALLRQHLS